MKKLFCLFLVLISPIVSASIVNITSPFNYQTLGKDVTVYFTVNTATLQTMPSKIGLFINNQAVKEIPYHASKYFKVHGLEDGTYYIIIAVYGVDGRLLHATESVRFNVRSTPIKVEPMLQ